MSTIHQRFASTAARVPIGEFLHLDAVTAGSYGMPVQPISRAGERVEVERLRDAYAEAGHGHSHRVGLLLENRSACLFHWFAVNAPEARGVPIHAELRRRQP